MGSRHPWEITLREFVEKARRDYGIEIDPSIFDTILSYRRRDGRVYIHVFRRGDRAFLLPGLDSDAILDPDLIRELCGLFNLPPLDFGLDPDPEDD